MTVAIRAEANTLLEEVKNINYEKEKLAAMNKELLVKYKKYKEKNQKLEDENKRMAERLKAFESLNDLVQGSGDPIESAHEEQTDALESADESNLSLPNFQNETMSLTDTGASNFLSKEMPPKVHVPPETTAVEQNVKETESLAAGQPRMPNFADDSLVSRQCVFAYEEALQELYLNSE
jgi:predicted nuclease with TOPRIM domain